MVTILMLEFQFVAPSVRWECGCGGVTGADRAPRARSVTRALDVR